MDSGLIRRKVVLSVQGGMNSNVCVAGGGVECHWESGTGNKNFLKTMVQFGSGEDPPPCTNKYFFNEKAEMQKT